MNRLERPIFQNPQSNQRLISLVIIRKPRKQRAVCGQNDVTLVEDRSDRLADQLLNDFRFLAKADVDHSKIGPLDRARRFQNGDRMVRKVRYVEERSERIRGRD